MIFECLHSEKRFQKTKFNNSDVEQIERDNTRLKTAKNAKKVILTELFNYIIKLN